MIDSQLSKCQRRIDLNIESKLFAHILTGHTYLKCNRLILIKRFPFHSSSQFYSQRFKVLTKCMILMYPFLYFTFIFTFDWESETSIRNNYTFISNGQQRQQTNHGNSSNKTQKPNKWDLKWINILKCHQKLVGFFGWL